MNDLFSQYRELTLNQLHNLKKNAILNESVADVLMKVIKEKENEPRLSQEEADSINQSKLDEEAAENLKKVVDSQDILKITPVELAHLKSKIMLTTETSPQGVDIVERVEIITAETVLGMNIFRDLFAGIRDVVGGRSKATQKVLRDARKICLSELKEEALMLGADAVIGVDLDYSEISGGGKSGMIFLVVSGTAVKTK